MFKHILVPVDGSSTAANAVEKAIDQARAFGAKLTLVTVIDNYPFTGVGETLPMVKWNTWPPPRPMRTAPWRMQRPLSRHRG